MSNDAPPLDAAAQHARWKEELDAAQASLKPWHEKGANVVRRYRAETEDGATATHRLNLFTVNVQTQLAMLKGKVPSVSVERKYADAADDDARVAGEMLERLLNGDIEKKGDTFDTALSNALEDRMLPGLGQVRIRYEAEFEKVPGKAAIIRPDGGMLAPAVPESQRKTYECVHTDYVHWRDFAFSPARTWDEVRWVAFGNDMSLSEAEKRFGKEVAATIPVSSPKKSDKEEHKKTPWDRARVWEIWSRDDKTVYWFATGAGAILDSKPDPLRLERFFPCPRPLHATVTTDKFLPVPDYELACTLYEEINTLTLRIDLLMEAVTASGVYDGANTELGRLLGDAMTKGKNKLIPVDNWAALGEKGGLRGSIDWMPLDQVVNAITVLEQQRQNKKTDLYEVTGLSDILRGQGEGPGVTAAEQQIKARFASVRLQKLQDDLAAFASEVQSLKAEVIASHYDVATILEHSNAQHTEDAAMAPQAALLLKPTSAMYRVAVKPEAMSMQDMAQIRSERTEILTGLTALFQAIAPMMQMLPGSLEYMLRFGQWYVAGMRGASQIEGVFDDAIKAAQQAAQAPPQGQQPDPKLQAQMLKGQQEKEKAQAELQADLVRIDAEVEAKNRIEANQRQQNVMEAGQKALLSRAITPPSDGPGGMPK